jgi:N-ethylmaleimide reductase
MDGQGRAVRKCAAKENSPALDAAGPRFDDFRLLHCARSLQRQSMTLFSPLRLGAIETYNRVFMAPLTRCRAQADTLAPTELNATYYAQRAGAGLIVSEATQIHPTGQGYLHTPGIYSAAHEAGWRLVTDAVHAQGGKMVAQLWHVGAVSHPDFQPGAALPVTASSGYNAGGSVYTPHGKQQRVAARGLEAREVHELIDTYAHAARVAKRAGFDGVEIHAANSYLLEQFIRDSSNRRDDEFGGSIANRLRFVLGAVDAAVSEWGAGRVGIRLSPVTNSSTWPLDSHTQATYGALVQALAERKLAYVHFIEGLTGGARELAGFDFAAARHTLQAAGVAYVANNQYTRAMAIDAIERGTSDAVAFGVPFISNPDLVERLRKDVPLTVADRATFYSQGAAGYTDYRRADL